MIKVRLYGGLGNQIFQLGISLYIAKVLKKKVTVCDFTDGYQSRRKNQLSEMFNLEKVNVSFSDRKDFLHRYRVAKLFNVNCTKLTTINDKNIFHYLNCGFLNIESDVILLDGYFQSCFNQDVFDFVADVLSGVMKAKICEDSNNKGSEDSFATVHIRGGDFLSSKEHFSLSKEYYEFGILALSEYVKNFIVVTDDKKYATTIIEALILPEKIKIEMSTGISALSDFSLIMSSKYSILSNSTFSIWAGALSKKNMVLAPTRLSINIKRNFKFENEMFWSEK
ncbi:TPA: alpha-1,2-fucosyltransferase [Vibrio harveyi]|nr:alpha-1,2-fucosyltransferase [Vibrio harveyi]